MYFRLQYGHVLMPLGVRFRYIRGCFELLLDPSQLTILLLEYISLKFLFFIFILYNLLTVEPNLYCQIKEDFCCFYQLVQWDILLKNMRHRIAVACYFFLFHLRIYINHLMRCRIVNLLR